MATTEVLGPDMNTDQASPADNTVATMPATPPPSHDAANTAG